MKKTLIAFVLILLSGFIYAGGMTESTGKAVTGLMGFTLPSTSSKGATGYTTAVTFRTITTNDVGNAVTYWTPRSCFTIDAWPNTMVSAFTLVLQVRGNSSDWTNAATVTGTTSSVRSVVNVGPSLYARYDLSSITEDGGYVTIGMIAQTDCTQRGMETAPWYVLPVDSLGVISSYNVAAGVTGYSTPTTFLFGIPKNNFTIEAVPNTMCTAFTITLELGNTTSSYSPAVTINGTTSVVRGFAVDKPSLYMKANAVSVAGAGGTVSLNAIGTR